VGVREDVCVRVGVEGGEVLRTALVVRTSLPRAGEVLPARVGEQGHVVGVVRFAHRRSIVDTNHRCAGFDLGERVGGECGLGEQVALRGQTIQPSLFFVEVQEELEFSHGVVPSLLMSSNRPIMWAMRWVSSASIWTPCSVIW